MRIFLLCFVVFASLFSCAAPKAAFIIAGSNKAPAEVQFKNQSINAESYEWTFGELGKSTDTEPSFSFPRAGNYLVTLKAMKGDKASVSYDRVTVEGPEDCMVLIETDYGNMLVKLYNATPEHQANFLKLAEDDFFDGLLFHRVINGFMIQGGDPKSKDAQPGAPLGSGGPGYTIPGEFVDSLVHTKGALAAARTGDQVNPQRRSSGSQFYIVHGRPVNEGALKATGARVGKTYTAEQIKKYAEIGGTPQLDANYTVFGQVIQGFEVIDKIAKVRKDRRDRPNEDVKMKISVVDYFPEMKRP